MEECKCGDLCYFFDDFYRVAGGSVTGFVHDQVKVRYGICRVILLPSSKLYTTYAEAAAEAEKCKSTLRLWHLVPDRRAKNLQSSGSGQFSGFSD